MYKLICFIILIFSCRICSAQNLVYNGDFEQFSNCPFSYGQFDSLLFWRNPTGVTGGGSPDYFNTCTGSSGIGVPYNYWGYQYPRSGQGYCGLNLIYYTISNFREYAEGQLTSPLTANSNYVFEMYLNMANASQNATDAFGGLCIN